MQSALQDMGDRLLTIRAYRAEGKADKVSLLLAMPARRSIRPMGRPPSVYASLSLRLRIPPDRRGNGQGIPVSGRDRVMRCIAAPTVYVSLSVIFRKHTHHYTHTNAPSVNTVSACTLHSPARLYSTTVRLSGCVPIL